MVPFAMNSNSDSRYRSITPKNNGPYALPPPFTYNNRQHRSAPSPPFPPAISFQEAHSTLLDSLKQVLDRVANLLDRFRDETGAVREYVRAKTLDEMWADKMVGLKRSDRASAGASQCRCQRNHNTNSQGHDDDFKGGGGYGMNDEYAQDQGANNIDSSSSRTCGTRYSFSVRDLLEDLTRLSRSITDAHNAKSPTLILPPDHHHHHHYDDRRHRHRHPQNKHPLLPSTSITTSPTPSPSLSSDHAALLFSDEDSPAAADDAFRIRRDQRSIEDFRKRLFYPAYSIEEILKDGGARVMREVGSAEMFCRNAEALLDILVRYRGCWDREDGWAGGGSNDGRSHGGPRKSGEF